MFNFCQHTFIVLGSNGLIGTEVSKELILLGVPKDKLFFMTRSDTFPPIEIDEKLIVINATSANGEPLVTLIKNLNSTYPQYEFWHVSTQAVQNNSEYGNTKCNDEKIVFSMCVQPKIYRLGVPIIQSGDTYHGLGYWNTVRLVRKGEANAYCISLCGVKLHLVKDMLLEFADRTSTLTAIGRYPLQSRIRRYLPYRRLNRLLSFFNICVIG